MHRILIMLVVTAISAGCAGFSPSPYCEGPRSNAVTIHYGDSELTVTPKVANVRRNGDFVLKLQPRKRNNDPAGVDYNAVNVTVVGKTANDRVWIPSKTASSNQDIVYPVPAQQAVKVYEYKVTVEKVGTLDPRVNVN